MKKKSFKGRLNFKLRLQQELWKGTYGIVAKEPGRLKESQIKAAEFALKRTLKKNGSFWIRLNTNIPVTKKPLEVRMGKGKGPVKYNMGRVQAGLILFELKVANEILARKAFKIVSSKLPIKTQFITHSI